MRATTISPLVVETELTDYISDLPVREAMAECRLITLKAGAIARAVTYAIEQPDDVDVDVDKIISRPLAITGAEHFVEISGGTRLQTRCRKPFRRTWLIGRRSPPHLCLAHTLIEYRL